MTPLLTDNLPLLAGAPNGVKKLRELILELAVRGRLVPQDPRDEPASELLERIVEEKARLVAKGKIKKQKLLTEITPEEKPFDIPVNWEWVRVAAVGHDWGQKTPDREFTYIDVGSVDNAAGLIQSPQVVAAEDAPSRARKIVRPGTLIYSTIRPYLLNIAVVDKHYEQEPIASTAFAVIHPYLMMPPRYFLWYLRSPVFVRYVESVQTGIAYPAINDGQFFSGLIPLPPLEEQHRIVSKVDNLMAMCDRLEARQADAEMAHAQLVQAMLDSLTQACDATEFVANWQRLTEHFHTLFTTEPSIDTLTETLLELAVMGKLVPQASNDDPAKSWLEKGQVRESKIRRGIPETVLMDDWVKEFPVPDSWEKLSTAQLLRANAIIDVKDGNHGANHPVKADWTESGLPFITAAQVKEYNIDYNGANKISGAPLQKLRVGFSEPGDVIYTHKGSVGRTAINSQPCILSPQTTYYRPNEEIISNKYLMYFFQSVFFTHQVDKVKNQTTRDFVPITQQYLFFILVPPIQEQHRIVAKVDQVMALCNQLKTRLNQTLQLNEKLACSLVEHALACDTEQAPGIIDQKTARTLLAAEVTHRLHTQRTFGQRKLQKVVYLAEHAAKLAAIQGSYLRNVAGPHDRQLMDQIESELRNNQWYERIERETVGHAYRPLPQAGQHRQAYSRAWSAAERTTIEQVVELMRDWNTDRCEMTVTLYAAWNDFVLEGRSVTDEAIVNEVMHSWNDTKLRFGKIEWLAVLAEMKEHKILMPTGFGQRTKGGMLSLPGVNK